MSALSGNDSLQIQTNCQFIASIPEAYICKQWQIVIANWKIQKIFTQSPLGYAAKESIKGLKCSSISPKAKSLHKCLKKIIPLHQFFRYQLWWTILPSFATFNPIPLPFHTIILPTLAHSLILFSQHQTLPWHWSLKPTPASLIILAMHICIMLVVYCKVNYKTQVCINSTYHILNICDSSCTAVHNTSFWKDPVNTLNHEIIISRVYM